MKVSTKYINSLVDNQRYMALIWSKHLYGPNNLSFQNNPVLKYWDITIHPTATMLKVSQTCPKCTWKKYFLQIKYNLRKNLFPNLVMQNLQPPPPSWLYPCLTLKTIVEGFPSSPTSLDIQHHIQIQSLSPVPYIQYICCKIGLGIKAHQLFYM